MYASKRLVEVEFVIGAQQQALNGTDLCLPVGWDLKVDFLEAND